MLPLDPKTPDAKAVRDEGPIHLAVLKEDGAMLRCLFDCGEDTNLPTTTTLRTPLHIALEIGSTSIVEASGVCVCTLRLLCLAPRRPTHMIDLPFALVCLCPCAPGLQQLLYRADVNLMARDSNGESPNQMAMRLIREAEASKQVQAEGGDAAPAIDIKGAQMVLDYLRKKVELERAMNSGIIRA